MSFGIIEVISLLLGLAGFGLHPNPKAPTADQALQYAMPDADLVVYFDAGSVIPGNYKVLQALPDDARIKASPALADGVRQVVAQIEGGRGLVKTMTGLDVTTDINDATAFVHFTTRGQQPDFVLEAHGTFTPALLDKLAKLQGGAATKVGTATLVDTGAQALALTKDGVLLAGSTALVKARIDAAWKAPARAAGSNLANAADVINGKPVFGFVVALSPAAREQALDVVGRGNFLSDLITRHKLASIAVYHDGIGWTWADSTKAGLESFATMSDGLLEVFRAGQIAPRGIAKIVLGGLASYRADKRIGELLDHKDDLMKLVTSFTGDGSFKIKSDQDPKTFTLHVRATGKTFSEVVPLGAVIPVMAIGAFLEMRDAPSAPRKVESVPTPVTPHR